MFVCLVLPFALPRYAGGAAIEDDLARSELIKALAERFEQSYVFPEVGRTVGKNLRRQAKQHRYDQTPDGRALAEALTKDLREMTNDSHVQVHWREEPLPPMAESSVAPRPEERDELRREVAFRNGGFLKLERLRGNVGYLELDRFDDPALAGDMAATAMRFLANTEALIIDLRENRGGHGTMVQLLCSYLLPEGDPVHLNDVYWRPEDTTMQTWTVPWLPAPRYVDKPVYILTSGKTHSAAEEFTYNLRALGRATSIGDTTRGGAHPVQRFRLSAHYGVQVSVGRSINPITKTNWEGTGIAPDLAASPETALSVAHERAIEALLAKATDEERASGLRDLLAELREQSKAAGSVSKAPASASAD
jgi:hypothetical protein